MTAVDTEIMKIFGFWSAVLVLKMLAMTVLTARQRFKHKVFANQEDIRDMKKAKVAYDQPDVERIRRAHLNDLENVLPWFIITYIWLTTGPPAWLAGFFIRAFVVSRIAHTVVYAIIPQQPARFLAFFVAFTITTYEAVGSLLYYL